MGIFDASGQWVQFGERFCNKTTVALLPGGHTLRIDVRAGYFYYLLPGGNACGEVVSPTTAGTVRVTFS